MSMLSEIAARTLRLAPRESLSRLLGSLAEAPVPKAVLKPVIRAYTKAYKIDLGEYYVPEEGFQTFNDFFARALSSQRQLDLKRLPAIVSPADGRVEFSGDIDHAARLRIKGSDYTVAELLGDAHLAKRYEDGFYAVVYLSPRDYHRVHAPVSGAVSQVRYIPGALYPVNDLGLTHVPHLFSVNERVSVVQENEELGPVTSVLVGATVVGGIRLSFDDRIRSNKNDAAYSVHYGDEYEAPAPFLLAGEELGRFLLGSTVIVFLTAEAKKMLRVKPGALRVGDSWCSNNHPQNSLGSKE